MQLKATSIDLFMVDPNPNNLHKIAAYLGTFIGSITFTGSMAAFIKLSGMKILF